MFVLWDSEMETDLQPKQFKPGHYALSWAHICCWAFFACSYSVTL